MITKLSTRTMSLGNAMYNMKNSRRMCKSPKTKGKFYLLSNRHLIKKSSVFGKKKKNGKP